MKTNATVISKLPMGHEIFAACYGDIVFVSPNEENKESYERLTTQIANWLEPICERVVRVPFEARHAVRGISRDVASELQRGSFADWNGFFERHLSLQIPSALLPQFTGLTAPVGWVPAKWKSDELCGKTADQQSTSAWGYGFLKRHIGDIVFLQHFDKVNDLEKVQAATLPFEAYIPGLTENRSLLGLRGVSHVRYYNLYAQLKGIIGIPGTHTWIAMSLFPEMPLILLANEGLTEDWELIGETGRSHGRKIFVVSFREGDNMTEVYRHAGRLFFEYCV